MVKLNLMLVGLALATVPVQAAPLHFSSEPSPEKAIALDLLQAEYGEPVDPEAVSIARVDFDLDGTDDILAFADTSFFCGSAGCVPRFYIYINEIWGEAPLYELVNGSPEMWSTADEPVNGWTAFVFAGESGTVTLVWDGEAYVAAE